MGPVLIQLPAMLRFRQEKARAFFDYLKIRHPRYRFALEARHPSWSEPEAIALLRQYRIIWVIAESGDRFASAELVTARHIYLRFHGPDGSYCTPYTKRTLAGYASKCQEWLAEGHDIWVFFNNDVHGHGIRNALTLKEMMSCG